MTPMARREGKRRFRTEQHFLSRVDSIHTQSANPRMQPRQAPMKLPRQNPITASEGKGMLKFVLMICVEMLSR
jgi:hypothetical protein